MALFLTWEHLKRGVREDLGHHPLGGGGSVNSLLIIRVIFVLLLGSAAFYLRPFELDNRLAAGLGLATGLVIVVFEIQVRKITLKRLIGAAIGSTLGICGAYLVSLILARAIPQASSTLSFLELSLLLWMAYIGLVVGASKGEMLNLGALGGLFGGEQSTGQSFKILDTSVIIDGRIADIVETGFMDGTLVIPQFVLRELQLVADSADSLKRNRGRRGLDILQRIQKMSQLNVQILEEDFPHVPEVDMKLIELAKVYNCKIVTNDFNLNKVAQLHGVEVLNINELANALKPIVLPGETMRVFILKEGKEYNQGVAYLDDGTMVVVDNAKKMISRTIDIAVTSVLQTTAGKMIFGRFDDRIHTVHEKGHTERHASSGREQPAPAHPAEARSSGIGAAG
ncbi:MAG TPA: PIN domain-containing protein [Blastocatellia bacterium]|nr:PIN domain-containing protein [Blastocatellia bacterium]